MQTLDTFYQSKDWIKLTRIIRAERVNEAGDLICARCGKPIVRAYDAICHHKIFLTPDNVNDAAVALNPENIEVVHHVCHNRIHDKLGYKRREVFLVYGSPLSGKSYYVRDLQPDGALICDIDLIWMSVTGGKKYDKPKALASVVFGIRDYLMDCIKTRRGFWNTAYIIGGYPLISERERICRTYGAREIYVEATREECLARLHVDPDGRDVKAWEGYIDEWWRRFRPSDPAPSSEK